jgi:hypothetical protein
MPSSRATIALAQSVVAVQAMCSLKPSARAAPVVARPRSASAAPRANTKFDFMTSSRDEARLSMALLIIDKK